MSVEKPQNVKHTWHLYGVTRSSEVIRVNDEQKIKSVVKEKPINEIISDLIANMIFIVANNPNGHVNLEIVASGFNQMRPLLELYSVITKAADDEWPFITNVIIQPVHVEKFDNFILEGSFTINQIDLIKSDQLLRLLKARIQQPTN